MYTMAFGSFDFQAYFIFESKLNLDHILTLTLK